MNRRQFLASIPAAAAAIRRIGAVPVAPRFGHRQANMVDEPRPGVFDLARRIPGLSGVELQVQYKGTTLWDKETLLGYKRAAEASRLEIPSLAGIWPQGKNLWSPEAGEIIRKSIDSARKLGASTILVVCLEANCPRIEDEKSYGPVVALLQECAGPARDAGVTLAMETSLTPVDDRRLIEMVNRPAVRLYYDLDNVERYHAGAAIPGTEILGTSLIRQVHLKNEKKLLAEEGRVNWAAAVRGLAKIGYSGWFVFETGHTGPQQCIEATANNIEFVKRNLAAA
jgi:sugar phosphate isomerase/epimerase